MDLRTESSGYLLLFLLKFLGKLTFEMFSDLVPVLEILVEKLVYLLKD
jgi:hypothetical protein